MCGLMGVIERADNGFTHNSMQAFKFNLYVNSLRGGDSTGVVGINKKGNAGVIKEIGDSATLMVGNPKWDKFQESLFKEGKIAFGHGRAATRGDISVQNAHPFVIDNGLKGKDRHHIILAHNGTLHQGQQLPGFHEFDVDSAWMAQKIFDLGPEEALSRINGAIACIWWDSKERAMFVYRNHERPLHFVQYEGTTHINSEASALMFIKYKLNMGYEWKDLAQFRTETLYRFDIKDPSKYTEKPIKHHWPEPTWPSQGHHVGRFSNRGSVNQHELENLTQTHYRPTSVVPLFSKVSDYEREVSEVWKDTIKQIAFIGGKKITTYATKSVTEETCEPWEEGLTLVSKIKDTDNSYKLKLNFIRTGSSYFMKLDRTEWHRRIAAINNRNRLKAADLSVDCVPMPGKKVHFHTKVGEATIRHLALCEQRVRPSFGVYNNDRDGTYVINGLVMCEVFGSADSPNGNGQHMKYSAYLMRPAPNTPSPEVELYFYNSDMTKEEVHKTERFVGKILQIGPQTNAEYEENKTHIKMYLVNAKPADSLTKKEIADIYESQEMTYDEGVIAYKKSLNIHIPTVTGPANEE